MENGAAIAAYEPALGGPGEPRLLGFAIPRLRDPRLRAAIYIAVWGIAGLFTTTIPDLATNTDHVMLYFLFLIAGVLLLLLAVAAEDAPAAARLEGWIRDMML